MPAHGHQRLHGDDLPVGQRTDPGCIDPKLLHLMKPLLRPQKPDRPVNTGTEQILIPPGLLRHPKHPCVGGQKFPGIMIAGIQIQLHLYRRILLCFRLLTGLFKFLCVFFRRHFIRPVIGSVPAHDIIYIRHTGRPELFLCIINDAPDGMTDISHISLCKQNLLQPVPADPLCPLMQQNLHQINKLGFLGFHTARDHFSFI